MFICHHGRVIAIWCNMISSLSFFWFFTIFSELVTSYIILLDGRVVCSQDHNQPWLSNHYYNTSESLCTAQQVTICTKLYFRNRIIQQLNSQLCVSLHFTYVLSYITPCSLVVACYFTVLIDLHSRCVYNKSFVT